MSNTDKTNKTSFHPSKSHALRQNEQKREESHCIIT